MKKLLFLSSFERSVKSLTAHDKELLAKSLETLNTFLITGSAPFGFRLKKLDHDKFEFRIDIRLRVVAKIEKDCLFLVLAGNHEDVRRYLRNIR